MFDSILADVRYSFRVLLSHRRFSLLVVLILALGIGATTAIFSAAKSVILAPLPFGESDRMVRVLIRSESDGQVRTTGVTPSFFHGLRERSRTIKYSAAQMYLNLSLSGDRNADRVVGIGVSDQWMETLGVRPVIGRDFTAAEEAAGEDSGVVLLSWSVWQERFAGREDVLGETLVLNGRPHVVVGVMPASFRYPYQAELWTPMRFEPSPDESGYLNVAARMKEGVQPVALEEEVSRIGDELADELLGRQDLSLTARPFDREFRRDPSHNIAVLLAAVSFVLLLACVNVANLILVRGGSRARDFAIRTALGASRMRQVRQLLIEGLILSLAGGVLGIGLARLTTIQLSLLIPHRLGEVIQSVTLDSWSLVFALAVSTATAVMFGLMPALRLTDAQPVDAMKSGGRFGSLKGRSTMRWLVVAEVALAFLLMTGAGVMGQDFMRLVRSDPGYDPTNVMTVGLGLPQPLYDDPAERARAIERIVEKVATLPGVDTAGVTTLHPIPHTTSNTGARLIRPSDAVTDDVPVVNMRNVTASYLETLGLQSIRGGLFTDSDRHGTTEVALVSERAASRYWPNDDPIGQQIMFGASEDEPVWVTIVGIVPDIAEPYDEIIGTVYRPYGQGTWDQEPGVWDTTAVTLLVRQSEGVSALGGVREAVASVDRDVSLFDVGDLGAVLAEPLEGNRFGALAFVAFGAFGLLLALLGTYGVIALTVNARVPEFGVRLALGLEPGGLLRLVVGYGVGLIGLGLALGLALTLALSRFLEPAVTQIGARDPKTIAVVAIAVVVAGVVATLIPARRAMKIDPVDALRNE